MGSYARDTIISEALQLAGNTGLTDRGYVWLQTWLDKTYASFPWAFITRRYGPFTLAGGATSFDIGEAATGIASSVTEGLVGVDHVYIADTSDGGYKGEADIVTIEDLDPSEDPLWRNATDVGTPVKFLLEQYSGDSPFKWTLKPIPVPEKAYRIIVSAQRRPAALLTNSVPVYPNDATMIQAVFCQALKHQDDERFATEMEVLTHLLAGDKVQFGIKSKRNQKMRLSSKVFPRAGRSTSWPSD